MFGQFHGSVITEWLDDGRDMVLLNDYSFEDPDGVLWTAKSGAIINGASIPQRLWSIVGAPYAGRYRNASVVHDYYCVTRERTWQSTHLMFYYGCLAMGIDQRSATILYKAVYHGGPRW